MTSRAVLGRGATLGVALGVIVAATSFPYVSAALPSDPEPGRRGLAIQTIDDLIAEAARRFCLPARWIRAVMKQESGFNPSATSRAGAMGLMQVMPATYAELRRRHDLGPDAYDPRDNIMAAAAYLRELHDRFGLEGMLPAYNAGPGRYLQHRDEGRPLPLETRDYVARIALLDGTTMSPAGALIVSAAQVDPNRAPLFPGVPQFSGSGAPGLFAALAPAASSDPVSP